MHRDSEGNALEITPGAMNLMTAGPVGLFIDDGALALAIIMIVLLSGVLSVRVEVGGKNRVDERTKSGRLRLFGFGRQ